MTARVHSTSRELKAPCVNARASGGKVGANALTATLPNGTQLTAKLEMVFLATKMPMSIVTSLDQAKEIFEGQLAALQTEYVDFYLFHALNGERWEQAKEMGIVTYLEEQQRAGRIRHFGFSFHDKADLLEQVLKAHPEVDFVQLQINYIDWNSPVEGRKCYEICEKYGKPVIVMEPVKGGSLANVPAEVEKMMKEVHPHMSPASWAIRYCASLPNVLTVLSGMSNMEQLDDNTSYMQNFQPLNEQETDLISRVVDTITKNIDIPCTACHYCTGKCPQHIAIPQYFGLMNVIKQLGESQFPNSRLYYNLLTKKHGKASDCIQCGQCEAMCPQHLPIIDNLVRMANKFEQK